MKKLILALLCAAVISPAADMSAEKEVLAAMDTWKQAVMKKDKALFNKALHPDLAYAHSNGLIETREQSIQHITGGKVIYEAVDFKDTKVKMLGNNTAVVMGKTDYVQNNDGKRTTINLLVTSVWVKGPQGWQMIARQSTRPTQ